MSQLWTFIYRKFPTLHPHEHPHPQMNEKSFPINTFLSIFLAIMQERLVISRNIVSSIRILFNFLAFLNNFSSNSRVFTIHQLKKVCVIFFLLPRALFKQIINLIKFNEGWCLPGNTKKISNCNTIYSSLFTIPYIHNKTKIKFSFYFRLSFFDWLTGK